MSGLTTLEEPRALRATMFRAEALTAGERPSISDSEYRSRQQRLLRGLEDEDLLLVVGNPESVRSNDVRYPYRNSSNLLYLCGWHEEHSLLACRKVDGEWSVELFVQPNDVVKEIWEGRRPGLDGAETSWPIDKAHSIENLDSVLGEMLSSCTRVLVKTGLDKKVDKLVMQALESKSRARQLSGEGPITIEDPSARIAELRLRKSPAEIEMMKYACKVSAQAHIEAMEKAGDGIGEWQLQAIIEGFFQWNGQTWAYPSIVGCGDNATILHYHANDKACRKEEVVLIDAGSEYCGYAADITRSWPIGGKFSEAQKEIYQVVLDAQKAAIDACIVGTPYDAPHHAARKQLAQGLIDLGISEQSLEDALSAGGDLGKWYMHNTGHWIGMDVHDVGVYRPDGEPRLLEEGMVLTVEPGLYFAAWREDVEVPERWAGIGIRIEDDVLVSSKGPVILSADCPKEIEELENIIGTSK